LTLKGSPRQSVLNLNDHQQSPYLALLWKMAFILTILLWRWRWGCARILVTI